MIRRWIEAIVFAALAIALHLAIFWAHPDDTGQLAGGAGGESSITMAGANAEMSEMIAEWDKAPDPDQTVDELTPEQPDQPTDVTADAMTLPVMAPPVATEDAPRAAQEIMAPTDAPVAVAAPVPAPTLQSPSAPDAPDMPAQTAPRAGLATPSIQTPRPPRITAPQMEADPVEPPEPEVAASAPSAAPTPQKKPKPPPQAIAKAAPAKQKAPAKPKAPAKAEAPAKPKAAQKPKPATKKPPKAVAADATGGASDEAAPAARASGAGGGAEAGGGHAQRNTEGDSVKIANLVQLWGGKIRRGVEKKKRSPRTLRRAGATQIAMTIARSGALVAASISQSSGQSKLDIAAMKAVKAAAPYAPAPAELGGDSYNFVLKIRFER